MLLRSSQHFLGNLILAGLWVCCFASIFLSFKFDRLFKIRAEPSGQRWRNKMSIYDEWLSVKLTKFVTAVSLGVTR